MTADIPAVKRRPCGGLEIAPVSGIEIGKAGHRAVELQFDRSCGAVTLLADNHLGLAVHAFAFGEPFREFLTVGLGGLAHLMIVFFAEYEEHDVGVLLDQSQLSQIRQLRPLVLAAFDLARQLRERKNRNVELFRQRLEPGGNFSDFLHAAFGRPAGRSLQELKVIDNQQIEVPAGVSADGRAPPTGPR